MTRHLILDCETTCLKLHPKTLNGNPFAAVNFLCCVGLRDHEGNYYHFNIQYGEEPYGEALKKIQSLISSHDCLVGFNIKFDLHWLDRYGISFIGKSVFDCQLVQFILSNQSNSYPSLHDTCLAYKLEGKLDVILEDFWKKGIDTDQIPEETLAQYLKQDVTQTYQVFLHQNKVIPNSKRRLISLQSSDLLVLLEMEKNGMLYDVETSKKKGNELQEELGAIDSKLVELTGYADFNPDSGDHISVVLYGGSLSVPVKVPYLFTYKDGRTVTKERWGTKEVTFKQIVKPLKGSELKKEGFYSTNADTLNNLRASGLGRKLIDLLLKRAELEKLRGTYLHGIPKLVAEQGWTDGLIHGQLNQCVAITGRLSSSKPNLQNMDTDIGYLFGTRQGTLINVDAKHLDWTAAVFLAQDEVGIKEIINGFDLHSDNVRAFKLPSRLIAKKFLFRIIFGGTAYSFFADSEFTEVGYSEQEWQAVIDRFYAKYEGIRRWHEKQITNAMGTGKLSIPTGREWTFVRGYDRRGKPKWPITLIKNYPVQGLEADLMMIVRVSLMKRIAHEKDILLINSVHDSVLLDCPDHLVPWTIGVIASVFADVPNNFKRLFGVDFNIPFRGETQIGKDWLNMEEVK